MKWAPGYLSSPDLNNARNLALNKRTYQSSTWPYGKKSMTANKAVDGNRDVNLDSLSCTHTDGETDPFWIVDLGRVYRIGHVSITNRLLSYAPGKYISLYICALIYTCMHTCLLLLISMLWHRQAIFESKGDELSSSAECRIRTQGLRHLFASRLNACWQTDWAIEDQAKKLNSTARPYDQQAFSPLDLIASWLSHLALVIYMFVVVNFDALARASDIRIERRQVVFLCWMQDSNPRSQTPIRQQTECLLTNRLSYRGSSYMHTYIHTCMRACIHTYIHTYLLLLISMLWHRQAIFESKGDKLSSSAESRIRTHQSLRHQIASRLNARWQTDWAIEDQAKNLNSTARPYDQQAFSPPDPTAIWHSHLALAIYIFAVVNFDALAQASDIRIERRQVVFLCWEQDSNPGGLWNPIFSRLNACWQTDWAIEDQAKNLNSTARPYDQQAFSPPDPTAIWHSHLALAIYIFVVVNFDALAQASDIRIERRQVVFLCWEQDSNPGGLWNPIFSRLNACWQTDWAIEDPQRNR